MGSETELTTDWAPSGRRVAPVLPEPVRVLVADPPWRFGDNLPGRRRGAAKHYPTLPVQDICAFPLPPLADDCVLFLWRVAAMQQEALDVLRAWGFTLKTEVVWTKKTSTGKRAFGMGRIVRAEHEVCLIATRGHPQPKTHSVRSTFDGYRGRHSAKPDAFYQLVETLFDGPYAEMFSRHQRRGWLCLGNEAATVESLASLERTGS
jgi:N6-adenosine-specific RNA methylase IME4